ncbi:hypothetical protein D082_14860 [Synechocystis sp. PCC 6714]|nr:hypothetical protein D082_14860 [Synechocystis sp. PCC 6714]
MRELAQFTPWEVDVITLSGSGEPTLAKNLEEILQGIKTLTGKPTLVLTNATLLNDPKVQQELAWADKVSVKLDGLWPTQLKKINRPIAAIDLEQILTGIQTFQQEFRGELSVQTMVIQPWDQTAENRYVELLSLIKPTEVQLNSPTRPKPLQRELEGRGNHTGTPYGDRPVLQLKCVDRQTLHGLAERLQHQTGITVRCAPDCHLVN